MVRFGRDSHFLVTEVEVRVGLLQVRDLVDS